MVQKRWGGYKIPPKDPDTSSICFGDRMILKGEIAMTQEKSDVIDGAIQNMYSSYASSSHATATVVAVKAEVKRPSAMAEGCYVGQS